MMALLQRVRSARVEVAGQVVGAIDAGLLVLLCAERGDTAACAERLLAKLLKLRIFSDCVGKMNHSLQDMDGCGTPGGLLLVSQFTLAADLTHRALRACIRSTSVSGTSRRGADGMGGISSPWI